MRVLAFAFAAAGAAVAASVSREAEAPADDLPNTVSLLQSALRLERTHLPTRHSERWSMSRFSANDVPATALATQGHNGAAPWKLFPAGVPGQADLNEGIEEIGPPNMADPIASQCGIGPLPHGYPDGYLGGHWVYNISEPLLLPFIVPADDPKHTGAAVVIAPGGGGRFLVIDTEGRDVALWLNSMGISAFVLKYRTSLKEQKPDIRPEIQRSISLVRSRAAEFGLNRSRVGFMGFSYGGMAAAISAISFDRSYSRLDAVDDFSFLPDFTLPIYPGLSPELIAAMNASTHYAPTFLAIAEDDPCCSPVYSMEFYSKLMQYGVKSSEMHVFSSGGHGYGICSEKPTREAAPGLSVCGWPRNAAAFLNNVVLGHSQHVSEVLHHHYETKYPRFAAELDAKEELLRLLTELSA